MSTTADTDNEPQITRGNVLEYFYAREALPHTPAGAHAVIRRDFPGTTLPQVQEAFRFLTDERFLEPVINPLGGKVTHWRITSAGKKAHEAALS